MFTSIRFPLLLVVLAIGLAGCNGEEAGSGQGEASEGLRIVPVFGPERTDVSADVEWNFSKVGKVESVDKGGDGSIFWINWAERFDSLGTDGVYPLSDGEIGVELTFKGHDHRDIVELPAAEDGNQRLELEITGQGRLVLEAEGLADDALMELGFHGKGGGAGGSETGRTGWRNQRGANYVTPGIYDVTLKNEDTGETHTQSVTIGEGETSTLTFTFTQ